jgi:hypothetical protein
MSYNGPDCKHVTYTNGSLTNRQNRHTAAFSCQKHAKHWGQYTAYSAQRKLVLRARGGSPQSHRTVPATVFVFFVVVLAHCL